MNKYTTTQGNRRSPRLWALALAAGSAFWLNGCTGGVKENKTNGGTEVSDSGGSCTIYIVEKDGYKFAVAVGYSKVAITQIK